MPDNLYPNYVLHFPTGNELLAIIYKKFASDTEDTLDKILAALDATYQQNRTAAF